MGEMIVQAAAVKEKFCQTVASEAVMTLYTHSDRFTYALALLCNRRLTLTEGLA